MANSQSTITLQRILDKVLPLGDVNPVLVNVSGYQLEPFLTICTDVMTEIYSQSFPYKWNEVELPEFYTNSFQQDYALVDSDGESFYDLEWLERGICVQMVTTANPKPWGYVEVGRQLTQATGSFVQNPGWRNPTFVANSFPNYMLYYGTWGGTDTDASLGNNPGAGSVYVSPLDSTAGQQQNPISQIRDENGNLLVVTTYGTCGSVAPVLAENAEPGTTIADGSVTWTVVDPNAIGIRILPVPSSTNAIFQFRLVGQRPAPNFDTETGRGKLNLNQTLAPFPDKYEPYFRQGVIAQCYRYSSNPAVAAKFEKNWAIWVAGLKNLRELQDREQEENMFVVDQGIMSRGGGRRRIRSYQGARNPFYPG